MKAQYIFETVAADEIKVNIECIWHIVRKNV